MSVFAVCVCVCIFVSLCGCDIADTVSVYLLLKEQGLKRRRQSTGTDKGRPV